MPIRRCSNGHLTGFRICPMCNSKQTRPEPGQGNVLMSKYELRKAKRATQRTTITAVEPSPSRGVFYPYLSEASRCPNEV
jgi:hypothetical protein